MNPPTPGPELHELLALFPPADFLQSSSLVLPEQIPEPYHHLLVNELHMTLIMEAFYDDMVNVHVLAYKEEGNCYARKILLSLKKTGKIIMFALVRIHLHFCSAEVRSQILARQTPLGRILLQHNVLRRIEPTAFLHVLPAPPLMQWFGLSQPLPSYGRLALIHCDEQPAIELLEIVAPTSGKP